MNNRWIKLITILGVAFLAVTMIGSFMGRAMMMRQMAMRDAYYRGAPAQFQQQEEGRGPAAAAPAQPEQAAPGNEQVSRPEFEQRGEQRGDDRGYGRGHGHYEHGHHGHHGRHGRHGGSFIGGIFGFLGGLVRLAGLGLLIMAGIVFLRDRGSSNSADDTSGDDDDPPSPDMTEAEIRAAMKRLGINKIEL